MITPAHPTDQTPPARRTPSIRSIETAVPPTVLPQTEARAVFAAQPGISRLGSRIIGAAFDASGIDTRHTVVTELAGIRDAERPGDDGVLLRDVETGVIRAASTGERNELYLRETPALITDAARRAIASAPGIETADVTHVVTVSCTGFYAPGPDYQLVRELGLAAETQRFHLGFMGCYGAFPALRAARSFCLADPAAVVLIVCVELCTIHLQSSNDPDQIVASSVFADGAAAAIVSARETPIAQPQQSEQAEQTAPAAVLELDELCTTLTPEGEGDMAWKIGDHGFEMRLSSYVPGIISQYIEGALDPLLAAEPALRERPAGIDLWAVHPGGRSILDKVQAALALSDEQLAPSRAVLRDYGNMSSATVLFILRALLHDEPETDAPPTAPGTHRVCAMAFGPGLTVETGLFTRRAL